MILNIDKVKMGKRIRMEYGEMQELADSIKEHGLLHPIVVDSQYNLIAGGRRLLACSRIGMKEIEVKVLGDLTTHELRVLELEENIKRKDLTELEKSKTLFELAALKRKELEEKERQEIKRLGQEDRERKERERDKQSDDETDIDGPYPKNSTGVLDGLRPKVGRPEKAASLQKIAQELNVPKMTLIDAQKHVEAVTQFPELENLPKYTAIEQAKQNNDPRVLDLAQQRKKREEAESIAPGLPDYNQYIDSCEKIANAYNKAIHGVAALSTNDQDLNAWKEFLDVPDMIQGYIDRISEGVPKLLKIQKFLRELRR
ncbi:MAG: ParB/RepB/Spo0J family partition protein [Desulfitobacteriaceae bacterium]